MSLNEYEQDIRRRIGNLSQSSGICFAVETIKRHYSLLQRNGIVPHPHAFCAELDATIAGLLPPFGVASISNVCRNAEEAGLMDEGVPVAAIELAISLQHFLDYIAASSTDCLERISYRCLSYIDSLHDIDDNAWFAHPEIQSEYAEQLATLARCAQRAAIANDA